MPILVDHRWDLQSFSQQVQQLSSHIFHPLVHARVVKTTHSFWLVNRDEKDRLTVHYMRIGHVGLYHSRTHHWDSRGTLLCCGLWSLRSQHVWDQSTGGQYASSATKRRHYCLFTCTAARCRWRCYYSPTLPRLPVIPSLTAVRPTVPFISYNLYCTL